MSLSPSTMPNAAVPRAPTAAIATPHRLTTSAGSSMPRVPSAPHARSATARAATTAIARTSVARVLVIGASSLSFASPPRLCGGPTGRQVQAAPTEAAALARPVYAEAAHGSRRTPRPRLGYDAGHAVGISPPQTERAVHAGGERPRHGEGARAAGRRDRPRPGRRGGARRERARPRAGR